MTGLPARGHTLLELLVAVVVTALVAAGGYSGLSAITRASAAHKLEVEMLETDQWLVSRLDRDLFHAIDRPVRSESGELPALRGDTATLSLTHSGLSNPLGQARSDLQRVDWLITEKSMFRHAHAVLDGPAAPANAELLLNHVSDLSFEFLGAGNTWHSRWPAGSETGLPRAVRYRMQIEAFGSVERVVELPGVRS
jgi:general secretion pathway protein J